VAAKWTGAELLKARWRSGETVDEAAWEVKDLGAWLETLRS
jgi:hypothetical protein